MRLTLANRISLAIVGVLALAAFSSLVAISSAYRLESLQETILVENMASVRAAEEVEIALLEQRGYVSAYILDGGNVKWLEQLAGKRKSFSDWMTTARGTARSDEEHAILQRLDNVQRAYASRRDEVVELYDAGKREEARQLLLGDVMTRHDEAYELCEDFIDANQRLVDATTAGIRKQVERVAIVMIADLAVMSCLGLALLWLFFRGVIFPLRRLAAEARTAAGEPAFASTDPRDDDMRELGQYVKVLMADVAETRSDLEQSRTRLAHAEKLAAVGKLAASVAHEIRNPLTSMKMWVYSLRRSLDQNPDSQHKLDVVSDEIVRLERIVKNFLEFSRPPQLNMSRQNVDRLLDKTLELVQQTLSERRIRVIRHEGQDLPEIMGDEEQLRQVLLNLINNALEAMSQDSEIYFSTARSVRGGREMITVSVKDTGPGMPEDVRARVFEPFFTTKEGGTGLGMCIAASVMARHGGSLELRKTDSHGTEWVIWIPASA